MEELTTCNSYIVVPEMEGMLIGMCKCRYSEIMSLIEIMPLMKLLVLRTYYYTYTCRNLLTELYIPVATSTKCLFLMVISMINNNIIILKVYPQ